MSGRTLERGHLGYNILAERPYQLEEQGEPVEQVLQAYKEVFPQFNTTADPTGVFDILDQKSQGSCQGHSLAGIFSACYFLATGRKESFSRACGYYLAQQKDGIRGDQGSTLSGGQWVATEHGMCREKDWPYPSRYNPVQPSGIAFPYKLSQTKPMKSLQEMREWIDAGLPIQTGITWTSQCDREIVDDYNPNERGGGHSTWLWQKWEDGPLNVNSWGKQWNGDGVHKWHWNAVARMLQARWTVFVGYAPTGMSFPTPETI